MEHAAGVLSDRGQVTDSHLRALRTSTMYQLYPSRHSAGMCASSGWPARAACQPRRKIATSLLDMVRKSQECLTFAVAEDGERVGSVEAIRIMAGLAGKLRPSHG